MDSYGPEHYVPPPFNIPRSAPEHLYIYPPWWSRRRGSCQGERVHIIIQILGQTGMGDEILGKLGGWMAWECD